MTEGRWDLDFAWASSNHYQPLAVLAVHPSHAEASLKPSVASFLRQGERQRVKAEQPFPSMGVRDALHALLALHAPHVQCPSQ